MMQKTDKFLIGIVAGIVLLVVVAFVVVLSRPEPTYQTANSPSAVAHNYMLALWQEDYARAYSYLSPELAGYPDSAEQFIDDIKDNEWSFNRDYGRDDRSIALEIVSDDVSGRRAYVNVRRTHFYRDGFFGTSQSSRLFEIELEPNPQTDEWQIVEAETYWVYCWSAEDGCNR